MKTILMTTLLAATLSGSALASYQNSSTQETRKPSSVVKQSIETCNAKITNCEQDNFDIQHGAHKDGLMGDGL